MNYQNARITTKEIKEQLMADSRKNGYGIATVYGPDDFDPRSEEYFSTVKYKAQEGYPVFNKLLPQFDFDVRVVTAQRVAESKERYPGMVKPNSLPKVLDTTSGVLYDCIRDAAEDYCVTYGVLYNKLRGSNKNNTGLILLEKEK